MKMKMTRTFLTVSVFATVLAFGPARAEIVKPRGDFTPFRTTAGEVTMLHTIIPMNNAHDIELLSFIRRGGPGPATQIPFELSSDYDPNLSMRTGADCMVSSARVVRDSGRLRVLYAHRRGEWLDKKPVTFQLFELVINAEEAPGTPALYFALKKKTDTKKSYCDVDEALDKEAAAFIQETR